MNTIYKSAEQQENISKQPSIVLTNMYSSTKNHPFISKTSTNNHNDENKNYKDAYTAQVVQQWNSQTSDPPQPSYNHFSSPFVDQLSSNINTTSNLFNENLSNQTDKNSNKYDLLSNVDQSQKSTMTMKKRDTPLPASYLHQRRNKKIDSSNSNSFVPHNNTKVGSTAVKKSKKSSPIFIAPKKTLHQTPSHSSILPFDELPQIKRKNTLERRISNPDDQNISPMTNSSGTSPSRPFFHSTCNSLDDEASSDESDHESLLIRKKNSDIKDHRRHSPPPSWCTVPSAIYITDPYGHSRTFDSDNNDIQEEQNQNEQSVDNDWNTLNLHNTIDIFTSPEVIITPPINLDKHPLHSIGEEEEDEEQTNYKNTNTVPRKITRNVPVITVSQADADVKNEDNEETYKEPLSRRWSDGQVEEEQEKNSLQQPALTKTISAASIIKQTVTPPVKISKTKYILMKLHLSSSSKDDESSISSTTPTATTNPPRTRTVRRSADKKRSTTSLSVRDDTNLTSKLQPRESTSTITSKTNNNHLQVETNSNHNDSNNNTRQSKPEIFGSVGHLDAVDSDDDIDGTFEKVKMGSQLSLNSAVSDAKSRYGLDISGSIEIKLTYTLTTGALDIFIVKCTNLARAKRNKTSDPFVKVYLLPDRSKNSKRKSVIKKNTTDPLFEEKFRYHVTKQEFETRIIWVSVWSQGSLSHNDFLGEIHIPLANCTLDATKEYELLAQKKKNDLSPNIVPTMDPAEISFQITFIENPKNKDLGTLQISNIEAKAIFYGRHEVEAICKGVLMPDKIKRKMPTTRKGPTPNWELPLRWDGVRRDNLKNTSIEISIWCQERFKKFMFGFIRLNLSQGHFDNKPVTWLDATKAEKVAWETFTNYPTRVHGFKLPLRPATIDHK
ncbi:unnamed protein product [Adineta steineri]|uniref:C2 domain-containing protein n=1 Tax=Adineta steineri TaxID=433720 RepID=A0A814BIE3_9BILA|nr:unnamed protein product [Adineta steineri]